MSVVHYKPGSPGRDQCGQETVPSSHPYSVGSYVDHIYNQGQLHSCTASPLCAAYGLDLKKQSQTLSGGYQDPNPSSNTPEYEGTTSSDEGVFICDTVKAFNRMVMCSETGPFWCHYKSSVAKVPPMWIYEAAQGNNLCKYQRLSQDIDQFRACLKDQCPFAFVFKVYKSFREQENGVIPVPEAGERSVEEPELHAVVAIGYNNSDKHFIILDSWAEKLGKEGYFCMPYEFIEDSELCFDFWRVRFAQPPSRGGIMTFFSDGCSLLPSSSSFSSLFDWKLLALALVLTFTIFVIIFVKMMV